MKPEIYTYFDASLALPGQGEMLFHWYHSWKKHGWEPRLLHPRTIVSHPWRKPVRKVLAKLFQDPVEQARRMAWLALDTLKKNVFFSEYDVINYDIDPDAAGIHGWLQQDYVYACWGFGLFGKKGVSHLLQLVLEGKSPDLKDELTFCDAPGMDTPLIHFSRKACRGCAKHDVVETYHRRY